jgi:hypothetical protein
MNKFIRIGVGLGKNSLQGGILIRARTDMWPARKMRANLTVKGLRKQLAAGLYREVRAKVLFLKELQILHSAADIIDSDRIEFV